MVAEQRVDGVGLVVSVVADVVLDGVDGEEVEGDDDGRPEERGEGRGRRGPSELTEVVRDGKLHGADNESGVERMECCRRMQGWSIAVVRKECG